MTRKIGIVTSTQMQKTIKVLVLSKSQHKKYNKIFLKKKNFLAHDALNLAKLGNVVLIESCAPISKYKNWKLVTILKI